MPDTCWQSPNKLENSCLCNKVSQRAGESLVPLFCQLSVVLVCCDPETLTHVVSVFKTNFQTIVCTSKLPQIRGLINKISVFILSSLFLFHAHVYYAGQSEANAKLNRFLDVKMSMYGKSVVNFCTIIITCM